MKQLAMVAFISFFGMLFSLHTFGESIPANVTGAAEEIIHVMENGDIQLEGWTLYARENTEKLHSEKEMQAWVTNKKEILEGFTWSALKEDGHGFKLTATNIEDETEKITFIMYGQKENMSTYIIYEISGTKWNETIASNVKKKLNVRSMQLFEEFPVLFTCVKGSAGDQTIDALDKKAKTLLKAFDANVVESVSEKQFVSYSAYSNHFKSAISTDNSAMNVQLALRNEGMGGKTTVIIGTPIITIEY
jgi:hypothetical protein